MQFKPVLAYIIVSEEDDNEEANISRIQKTFPLALYLTKNKELLVKNAVASVKECIPEHYNLEHCKQVEKVLNDNLAYSVDWMVDSIMGVTLFEFEEQTIRHLNSMKHVLFKDALCFIEKTIENEGALERSKIFHLYAQQLLGKCFIKSDI